MIDHVEFKIENGEEVLYCYLSYDYEFGEEFLTNIKEKGIYKQLQNWLSKNKIAFHGKKVVLLASGIVIASLLYNTPPKEFNHFPYLFSQEIVAKVSNAPSMELEEQESLIQNNLDEKEQIVPIQETLEKEDHIQTEETPIFKQEVSTPIQQEPVDTLVETPIDQVTIKNPITIYRSGNPVVLEFEDYIAGVVAAEMPASFHPSALRAQAVLARTYALKRVQEGKQLTDSTATQVYYDEMQLRKEWGSSYDMYWQKIKEACQYTQNQTLQYQGNYIDAVYHSTSNGKTEAARNVWGYEIPYLQSVDSHWDFNTTFYNHTITKDINQLLNLFGITNLKEGDIEIMSRNESGRVSEIRIQNQTYQGVDLRSILGLRSSDFDISIENGNLVITTKGWGHGVGMSQYGANGMARESYTYNQILNHYYPGTYLA